MATYRITNYVGIVPSDTPQADTLIITRTGLLPFSVDLGPQGGWTVTVDGAAQGGIDLVADNTSSSTITIGRTGFVQGDLAAVRLQSVAKVYNNGLIVGETGIEFSGNGPYVIMNTGTIMGGLYSISSTAGSSNDLVTNLGTLSGHVNLGDGADRLSNSGRIVGSVALGEGGDVFTNHRLVNGVTVSGIVTGAIALQGGDDAFSGGANSETVDGGAGSDNIVLGAGNDTFLAFVASGDGTDTIIGGAGRDTYVANTNSSAPVLINLDNTAHFGQEKNIALGADIGVTDKIFGFENAVGGGGSDAIYGSGANNVLYGLGGSDGLYGFGGNDSLLGDAGDDELAGGLGRDTLEGGSGVDKFVFKTLAESGATAATRDVIRDFKYMGDPDIIQLTGIDANTKVAGNQDFVFIGTDVAFNHVAGELRGRSIASGGPVNDTLVQGDVNGDGKADFSILLKGAFTLQQTDFYL